MPIPNINISDYNYELPEERIARYPLEERDLSKLLVYRDGAISQTVFKRITELLPENSPIVFNDTKVIRARLKFQKETGAEIEVFCLEPLQPIDVQLAFETHERTVWKCIVGNSKKWKSGRLYHNVVTPEGEAKLEIERLSTMDNTFEIAFEWDNRNVSFADIIESFGVTPIPPYLNRETEEVDKTRYQTVYSHYKGSVAAPTAGLHFTQNILNDLQVAKHQLLYLTLHVGAGTFKPVQTNSIGTHVMHTEHIVVEASLLRNLLNNKNRLVAVGTTSVRTLESLYWLGVKLLSGQSIEQGVSQWDAYELEQDFSVSQSLNALLNHLESLGVDSLHNMTQIMIVPGYKFRLVDVLVTNFHQPHSTLLLLIGAFIGKDWKQVYDYALSNDFRFLSYGDSSLLFRKD